MKNLYTAVGITICLVLLLLTPKPLQAHVDEDMPDAIAKMEYLMLLDINPKDIEARYKLAMIYLRQEKFQEAEDELQQVLQAEPTHFHALEGMGLLKSSRKEFDESGRYFRKAISIDPEDNHIYYYLGKNLEAAGDYTDAHKAYNTAIDNHRQHVSPDAKHYNEDMARFEEALQKLTLKTKELKDNK